MSKWNQDEINYAIKLKGKGLSSHEISEKLSKNKGLQVSDRSVRRKLQAVGEPMSFKSSSQSSGETYNRDGVQTSTTILEVVEGHDITPEDLLKAHHYNPKEWEIVSNVSNFWKQSEGVTSYQTKISVKPKYVVTPKEFSKIFNKEIKSKTVNTIKSGKNNLVIPLFDLHFGIMNYENMLTHLNQVKEIISRGYDKIVIENGGDLFHSDYVNKTMTVKGTQLDHVNMIKAISDAKRFYDDLIEFSLLNSNSVYLYSVGGNHDFDLSYMFIDAISDRFPQIEVHNTSHYRQCFTLGAVSILLAHGDKAQKKLPMLFATENPVEWSNAKYREIHYGHYHKEVTNDDYGVVTRQFGTPKLNDPYEEENGYTMANHKLQIMEYSSDNLKAIYNV